ncbi:uncharacterized protein [Salminus brasiliensis]|uniref:uncharacterized protein isoform X2 n=1 Tax=Salminus brasiliensis TaxID=930266 RepID=UPI003B830FD1
MTEEELENAFCQLALAFHCDQHTLDQRLQAEEHARNYAEENLKLEVERGQDLLETLKGMCLDIKRAKVIQSLELCLNIISGTIERIANTAEVLGAVHQPALRRRISAAIISKQDQTQGDIKFNPLSSEDVSATNTPAEIQTTEFSGSTETKPDEVNDHQCLEQRQLECAAEDGSPAVCNCGPVLDPCTLPSHHQNSSSEHHKETDMPCVNKSLSTLPRHRLKSKAALETSSQWAKGPQHSLSVCNTLTVGLYVCVVHLVHLFDRTSLNISLQPAPPDTLDASLSLDNYHHLPSSAVLNHHASHPSLVSTGSCVVVVSPNAY